MYCVYKITREDGLIYIGKTKLNRLKYRIKDHIKTNKFINYNIEYDVLFYHEDHSLIEDAETFYISIFNSHFKGLNKTKDGKAKNNNSYKFSTYGIKMSNETKNKIRQKSKLNKNNLYALEWRKNLSLEDKKKFSEKLSKIRKGRIFFKKYNEEQIINFLKLYKQKPYIDYNIKSKNGKPMNYERIFCKTYSENFGIKWPQAYKILLGKTLWNPLLEKILDIKF